MTTDHNEAMRLADRISPETDWYEFDQVTWCNEAAALIRKQAAELKSARAETNRIIALLDAANDERKALRAEVERLRADAERMDWLETHATDAHAIHDKDGHVQSFQFDRDEDDSLRAAIDTARKATQ